MSVASPRETLTVTWRSTRPACSACSRSVPSLPRQTQPCEVFQYGDQRTLMRYRPGCDTEKTIRVGYIQKTFASPRPVTIGLACRSSYTATCRLANTRTRPERPERTRTASARAL